MARKIDYKLPPHNERQIPEDVIKAMAEPVGRIIIQWANVDMVIEMLVVMLHRSAKEKGIDVRKSLKFDAKLKALKKCFKQIDGLADLRDDALHQLERAKEISHIRHCLVHGTFSHWIERPEPAIAFTRLHPANGGSNHVRQQDEILTVTIIHQSANNLLDLAFKLAILAEAVLLKLFPEMSDRWRSNFQSTP